MYSISVLTLLYFQLSLFLFLLGTCDFAKFEGLEGVYVANIYDSDSLIGTGSSFSTMGKTLGDTPQSMKTRKSQRKVGKDPNIRTVMTFNKGGQWQLLYPPTTDSRGQKLDCVCI